MNGWKNYQTWACNLWLTNEESSYFYWMNAGKSALNDADGDREQAACMLADQIKDALTENAPEMGGACLYSDLLGKALQDIDYIEVAKAFLEE